MSSTHISHLANMVADETIRLLGVKSTPNAHTHTVQITPLAPLETSEKHTQTHSNQGPMSPYRARNGQRRNTLVVGRKKNKIEDRRFDFCSFEVMSTISNITVIWWESILFEWKEASTGLESDIKNMLGVMFYVLLQLLYLLVSRLLFISAILSRQLIYHDAGFNAFVTGVITGPLQ